MNKTFIFVLLGLLLFSCTHGTQELVIQKSSESFLHFVGNPENVKIIIDDGQPFELEKEPTVQRYAPHLLYKIEPGKHTIKVYRNKQLIVDRIIYVSSSETKEIEI